MPLRALRIAVVAAALFYLFEVSRRAGLARGNPELPGTLWAIGILSFLFLLRASMSEYLRETTSVLQRDVLWGLSLGGLATIVTRL
jgi:hypothetical protein